MGIPKTKNIDVDQSIAYNNELFCLYIENIADINHLESFYQELDIFLPEFVFSKSALKMHQEQYDCGETQKTPLIKARELLQKTPAHSVHNSGELGEFLLYLFATKIKGAHKLFSKIAARGNTRITIPGRDGTYILTDEHNNVFMLLGEAKVHPDGNNALREAQGDLNNFWNTQNIQHEINLASTHISSELTTENYDLYRTYFIDDHPNHQTLQYKNIVFIGYSTETITNLRQGITNIDTFKNSIISDLTRCFTNQEHLINASPKSNIYCFLPFECVDAARNIFAQHNNLLIN